MKVDLPTATPPSAQPVAGGPAAITAGTSSAADSEVATSAGAAGTIATMKGEAPEAMPDASPASPPTTLVDAGANSAPEAGQPAATCAKTSKPKAGDTVGSIDIAGARRTYIVHVPPRYTGETPVPLLVDLHGLFGNGQGQLRGSGTAAVADREGFISVYPDGIDNAWNIGPCCTQDRKVDDVGFMRALVEKLTMEACIDRTRVYATGVSMGGGMSHYLACEAADTFAAVAPAAFDLLEENTCKPSRPISVLSARGTSDAIVPYSGGASTPPNGVPTTIHFRGAEGTFREWARINGCTGSPGQSYDTCQSYTECKGSVEVTLCTEKNGRHTYGDPERSWKMLSKHSLP